MGLAARGARHVGEETERIEDVAELEQVRRQARTVTLKSLAVALVVTGVIVAVG